MKKKILVITAHADDMEFMAGGTIAKAISKGHSVYLIITTNNEKGSYSLDKETLVTKSREIEAINSAKFLGVENPIFLEYKDGDLNDVPINELREIFMRAIRRIKPDVLMTWDPFAPFETHPDHRQVAIAACEAAEFAHLPLFYPEHKDAGIEPHYVPEYLFFAKHPAYANRVIDISEFIDKKIKSILIHESQTESTIKHLMLAIKYANIGFDKLGLPNLELNGNLDPKIIEKMIDIGIRLEAGKNGPKKGLTNGEEFRYEGFGLARQIFPDAFANCQLDL